MKSLIYRIILFAAIALASCKQNSAFKCYICKSTAIKDSAGTKTYTNLDDYTRCDVDEAYINQYQATHNSTDTVGGYVIDTVTLCSRF